MIEIAENSLEKDLTTKAVLYARGGIPEYWVANLVENTLVVFGEPANEGYRDCRTLKPGEPITPVSFPDLEVAVEELLP